VLPAQLVHAAFEQLLEPLARAPAGRAVVTGRCQYMDAPTGTRRTPQAAPPLVGESTECASVVTNAPASMLGPLAYGPLRVLLEVRVSALKDR
jgi:hypothetical protein